jgi:signal transduction histidine kinase
MRTHLILTFLLYWLFLTVGQAQPALILQKKKNTNAYDLTSSLAVLPDSSGKLTYTHVTSQRITKEFKPFAEKYVKPTIKVYWLRFAVHNQSNTDSTYKIGITFTDDITLYEVANGVLRTEKSGDLIPLYSRETQVGQMAFVSITVPISQTRTYYIRLENSTSITQQLRKLSLQSIKLLPAQVFQKRFVDNRIYQALFFGALLVMLVYNLFIFIALQDRNYLYYLFYLFALLVFFASNSGYLVELCFPQTPRTDLYIRFISAPILLIFYLLFSKSYLKTNLFSPVLNKLVHYLMVTLMGIVILMPMGLWALGRSITVVLAVFTMTLILIAAIQSYRQGFTPARFFLAGNVLLLIGGTIFAGQRYFAVVHNPLVQYSIQLASILEATLFSIGLADRINLIRRELAQKNLENERLERQRVLEMKNLVEEKNRELEKKVLLRTAQVLAQKEEVMAQKEEIETQKGQLEINYHALEEAQHIIREQHAQLFEINQALESRVVERTQELHIANTNLQKAVQELDEFIYRTAHDIRGPLARLLGLNQIALLDIQDAQALDYFHKLHFEATYLNYILSRLSSIYEINHLVIRKETFDLKMMIETVFAAVRQKEISYGAVLQLRIETPGVIYSDYRLLQFILQNLIENAVRFQSKEEGTAPYVLIKADSLEKGVQIQVLDNGVGIDPQDVPVIFDMFSRAAGKYHTAGLGLYMAKVCVEKLNGSIQLMPNTGHLTEFRIQLPYEETTIQLETSAKA